jgi:eukaryotic-like serine/threonine-protein kinase
MSYPSRGRQLFFFFSCLLLLVGLASCSNPTSSAAAVAPTSTPANGSKTATNKTSTVANTSCPASGKGRAANMPAIALGNRQEIVSYRNTNSSTTLQEFDVQGKTSSTITSINGETIFTAQISQSGQWVLFVAQKNGVQVLQLVRVDGQDLQTLYCASIGQKLEAQWSPNQQQIIFSQISKQQAQLLLLNTTTGLLQTEYTDAQAYGGGLEPLTWLDNSHVYIGLVSSGPLYQPENLYVLDTSKGANQQQSDLKILVGSGDSPWNFDCSVDGKTVYYVTSKEPPRADVLESTIFASPALSGSFTNATFTTHNLYITAVRVINATTLMLFAQDPQNKQSSVNGLYTVGTNGRGLKRLTSSSDASLWAFNVSSQYTWSNFSRNGAYYVDGLSYGAFSGGPLTSYGSQSHNDTLVGWTTK